MMKKRETLSESSLKPIMRSRLKWWENPLLAFSPWRMRRVSVFEDRIEIKYPLHKDYNYEIQIADIDAFCQETKYVETIIGTKAVRYIYLLTGRKLWLFLSDENCPNFADLHHLLEHYFLIPERKVSVSITNRELSLLERGKHKTLKEISRDELASFTEQRRQRPRPDADYLPSDNSVENTRWRKILLVISIAAAIWGAEKVWTFMESTRYPSFPIVDSKTKLPSEGAIMADNIWIYPKSCSSTDAYQFVKHVGRDEQARAWVFILAGCTDRGVIVPLISCSKDTTPVGVQINYCIRLLRQRHKYDITTDRSEQTFLVLADETPRIGRAMWDHHPQLSDLRTASQCGDAFSSYKIAELFSYGSSEVSTNKDSAMYWYEKSIRQSWARYPKVDALNEISYLYAERSQYRQAMNAIDSAISIAPDVANLYDSKGEHLFRLGDKKGAQAMWNKTITLDPQFEKTHKSNLKKLLEE